MRIGRLRHLATALLLVGGPSACDESTANSALSLVLTGTLNDPDVSSLVNWVVDGGAITAEDAMYSVSDGVFYATLSTQSGGYRAITINVPARLGTYALQDAAGVTGEGSPTYVCYATGAEYCDNARGTITVTRATVRSEGDEKIFDVAVTLNASTASGRQLRADVAGCVDRHGSASCSNSGGDGGNGGGGGDGGGNETCVNSFQLQNVTAYYSSLNVSGTRNVTATGMRVNQSSTAFAGTSPTIQALVLNSTDQVGSPAAPRYQLQIYFPGAMRTISEMPFLDNNNIAGLENGAAGWLSLRGDGVFDGLRSNRDYSRTIVMGRLNITATSPKIRGTISSLRVIGDGFPSLSNSEGYVQNVVFCIDP